MAASRRNRAKPDDLAAARTRSSIQTTQLVKRLSQFALGQKDEAGNEVKLSRDRIKAIEILLNKTLPNLVAAEITGENGGPIIAIVNITASEKSQRKAVYYETYDYYGD